VRGPDYARRSGLTGAPTFVVDLLESWESRLLLALEPRLYIRGLKLFSNDAASSSRILMAI
jgi:hypothetical protein